MFRMQQTGNNHLLYWKHKNASRLKKYEMSTSVKAGTVRN